MNDAAIIIAPDLAAKRDIVQNAIDCAIAPGIVLPRVAVLAAVETVHPAMVMQVQLASDAPQAAEAIDLYVYRTARATGSLVAMLGGLDTLAFTAGVGENSPPIRQRIADEVAWLGVEIDEATNRYGHGVISSFGSRVTMHVIPADEERAITTGMIACLGEAMKG